MKRRLYTLSTRDQWIVQLGNSDYRKTTSVSSVSNDDCALMSKPLSHKPGELRFEFLLGGDGAGRLAAQFSELLDSDYGVIPFFGVGESTEYDGYYVAHSGQSEPLDATAAGSLQRVGAVLKEAGTRQSHWRSVEMNVSDTQNDITNNPAQSTAVGIPAAATLMRWFDPVADEVQPATPSATTATEFGDVALVAASDAPTDSSALIYDLPYVESGKTDVRVWDNRGVAKTDAENVVQWDRVFVPDHDCVGSPVVSNGAIRLTLDAANGIAAERWVDGSAAWQDVELNDSDWSLVDADLVNVAPASMDSQLLFENSSSGVQHALNMRLGRGRTKVLFTNPSGEDNQTPSGLADYLRPIASDEVETTNASLNLRSRQEVRR
ncbi:hypothetical protein [Halogeometricum borinquense]|uniref:hypothetical protein n=1 Tax=Halogeometricum borinquense TaxID=60847 RepID=UPI003437E370